MQIKKSKILDYVVKTLRIEGIKIHYPLSFELKDASSLKEPICLCFGVAGFEPQGEILCTKLLQMLPNSKYNIDFNPTTEVFTILKY